MLIDFRHKPTDDDVMMYEYLKHYNIPVTLICTKFDKVGSSNVFKNKKSIMEMLHLDDDSNLIMFSSVTKNGKEEVYKKIEEILS